VFEQADSGLVRRQQSPAHVPAVEKFNQGVLVAVHRVEISGKKRVAKQLDAPVDESRDVAKDKIAAEPFTVEDVP
jgi:hypothetical protein